MSDQLIRHTYALAPLVEQPRGDDDYAVIQIRSGGRERVVSAQHHAYRAWLGAGHVPDVRPAAKAPCAPEPLTQEEAEAAAVERHMGAYLAALARWDAFGGTKAAALGEWKAAVTAERDRLMGEAVSVQGSL